MLPAHYRNDKETSYFCRFTFGQFFTLLIIEIFTLFFIFYLGARYGKELLGVGEPIVVTNQKTLPELTTTNPEAVAVAGDPAIKELAKEIVHKTAEPDLKNRISQMLEQSAQERNEAKATPPKVEEKPAVVVVPEGKPAPVAVAPKPAEPPTLPFTVQVGSYPTLAEASQFVEHWKVKGYPAYYASAELPGKGLWYRVRVGQFPSQTEAQTFLDQFKARENVEAFVAKSK